MQTLLLGDCLDRLKDLPDCSVDSVITDPPYGINFMGKKWDYDVPSKDIWLECLRVLKPGGVLIAFAGSKTQHRMATRIESAGFEIVDMLLWAYGSGFPKSHNVANNIDKMLGETARGKAVPTASLHLPNGKYATEKLTGNKVEKYVARTEAGKPWEGWGTNMKPALEPMTMARKPGGSPEVYKGQRVFYHSKASNKDRDSGMDGVEKKRTGGMQATMDGSMLTGSGNERTTARANTHPTVKPTPLMVDLCKTFVPHGGVVLDPFMGSGSTGKAAALLGISFIGIERDEAYFDIATIRIEHAHKNKAKELV